MSITQIEADLTAYRAARAAILTGAQSYNIAGMSLTRGDLRYIDQKIERLESRLSRLENGGKNKTSPILGA